MRYAYACHWLRPVLTVTVTSGRSLAHEFDARGQLTCEEEHLDAALEPGKVVEGVEGRCRLRGGPRGAPQRQCEEI